MTYIADKINDEYKTWKLGPEDRGKPDTIFISAPTGSGKTTFILDVFLPYLAKREKRLLYLVNRTILKKQLEERICLLPYEQRSHIDVKLYQTIEMEYISSYNSYIFQQYSQKYDCVVCDEAHYFLADSNYNTNTIFSYNFVKNIFRGKLRIYMSATIEKIKEIVKNDNDESVYYRTPCLGIHGDNALGQTLIRKHKNVEYQEKRNYDDIEVYLLPREIEEIAKIVNEKGNEKWLIFVDSKDTGRKLTEKISGSIFIMSSYEREEESLDEVNEIVQNDKSSKRVLIATSVLDNGINLKDIELKNAIIMVDNEVEFVQMLGRKRRERGFLNLYLLKRDKAHFRKRFDANSKKLEIAKKSYSFIEENVRLWLKQNNQSNELEKCEQDLMWMQHKYWLPKLMAKTHESENIRTIFTAYNGVLFLNVLALKNLENLNEYYWEMIEKFDKYGENAFLREQLSWLGKSDQEIGDLVEELNLPLTEKSRRNVIEKLEEIAKVEMEGKKAKDFKKMIRDDLKILIESADADEKDKEKFKNNCAKTSCVISKQFMKFLAKYCKIPYELSVKNGKYTFEHISK